MTTLSVSRPLPKDWELAEKWRDGGTPTWTSTSSAKGTRVRQAPHERFDFDGILLPGGAPAHEGRVAVADSKSGPSDEHDEVVSLAVLRTCYSERYGSHIPRMFHDLLVDLAQAFASAAVRKRERESVKQSERGHSETSSDGAHLGGRDDEHTGKAEEAVRDSANDVDGDDSNNDNAETGFVAISPPVFHVTEYDVTKGHYPESWDDYAGFVIPGGVASACGDEPWMLTFLDEMKGLRDSGRPVLAFCLGHQALAQALGGLVRLRTDPRKHYALQESELLVDPPGTPTSEAIVSSIRTVAQEKEGGGGRGQEGVVPKMKLLYHHNDEVVQLPPGATNIATSRHCAIHGMMMMAENPEGSEDHPRPNLLTFQAHPELNYEYGRRVMDGLLDADVVNGRLTHEKARRLKEQVSAWDHKEFPVALDMMRQLFQPIVPRRNGGSM